VNGVRSTEPPRRVSIQGISGSGKTTLGRELARRLGLRHLETDALVHGPNWTETPDAELRALVSEVIRDDRWVIDSDYRRKLGTLVLEHADTAVWLDLPLHLCLRRLWSRTARRIRGDERLWNDNAESWRTALVGWDSLFVYAIRKYYAQRRTLPRLFAQPQLAHLKVVRLRSPGEVSRWLNRLGDESGRPPQS
jgi:adenylate kinase family enzyme